MDKPLIIVGASARAAAGSARRAGYAPWCVDLFADRDLMEIATTHRCPAAEYPNGILKIIKEHGAPAGAPVLLTGAMENHLKVVKALEIDHPILGPGAEAIATSRRPLVLPAVTPFFGLRRCKTIASNMKKRHRFRVAFARWRQEPYLIKPLRGCGGTGIRFAEKTDRVEEGQYLQQYVSGTPISAVFATDGWSVKLLGVTEQIIGDTRLGSTGFQYAGSIGPYPTNQVRRQVLAHLGAILAQQNDLRGIFGVDLIRDARGFLWPVEVNPRYTASVEIVERVVGIHCLSPWPIKRPANAPISRRPTDGNTQRNIRQFQGKAIVFAKDSAKAPDLYTLFDKDRVADVPPVGQRIAKGQPICTIFASDISSELCLKKLHEMASRLYTHLAQAQPPAANLQRTDSPHDTDDVSSSATHAEPGAGSESDSA